MALLDQFPEVTNVAWEADPQPGNAGGSRAIVTAHIDVDATDPDERERNADLFGEIERALRALNPLLTRVTVRPI